ncbi:MAG: glycosyltransferase [Candidatus Nanoarchaeia archaeon]|nr:glycosyltransferase [Candidatus Nanoarchaeia archaeon]
MNILTTNSSGNDRFGGIHTRKLAQINHSPQHKFHLIELNHEKDYAIKDNCILYYIDLKSNTHGKGLGGILFESKNFHEFTEHLEKLVNSYQNIIRSVNPEIILIPGTSINSFCLLKAAKREEKLDKTVQEYAGILEKEIDSYSGDARYILQQMGKQFVSEISKNKVTYLFPSNLCKETVEQIHDLKLDRTNIIWNGVSEEFLEIGKTRSPPSVFSLGYVGRIHSVKNIPFFLNINEYISKKPKLKMIADIGNIEGKADAKKVLKSLSEEKVYFYAPRNKERLAKFYAKNISASVVSSFFETYCNGAVESIISGTPCILSNRAGVKEVFMKHGLEKLIYCIDNIESFKDALEYAKSLNFIIPEDQRNEIYEDISWEKSISKYNLLFEEVSAKK